MATILVIILRVSRPNFVHFRTVNAQKPSPKGEAAAWSAYSWIRACRCCIVSVPVQVKGIMCDADDMSHWLTSYRDQLKASALLSALPDVMHQQLAQFMVRSLFYF